MTKDQAYRAVFFYLDEYYRWCSSAELGQVLGDIQPNSDGKPMDPAVSSD